MRTLIELREHETIEQALDPDQASVLRGINALEVLPGWKPGSYQLRARSIVGAVNLDKGLVVRILPKLPVRRVVFLLCRAANLAGWEDNLVEVDDDASIDVAVAVAFATAAEKSLRRGPRSSYSPIEADLAEVRGRVDINRQRLRYGLPLPVSVAFDEFGVDIPENRLLLGATRLLQRMPDISRELRGRLRRIAAALDGVAGARPEEALLPVQFSRLNEHLRPAVALARAVLEGVSFDVRPGGRLVTGFTVDMNVLFEKFLESSLAEALARYPGRLEPQLGAHLDRGRSVSIRPDLTWSSSGRPAVVIDAKYKGPADGVPPSDDLYQAVAYCVALGIRQALLVYGVAGVAARLGVGPDIELRAVGLDLSAPAEALRQQIATLAQEIAPGPDLHPGGSVLGSHEIQSGPGPRTSVGAGRARRVVPAPS